MGSLANPPAGAELIVAETQVFSGAAPIAYTDLDLSAVVGHKHVRALLKISTATGTTNEELNFRRNGETEIDAMKEGVSFTMLKTGEWSDILVDTDANGIIEWCCSLAVALTTIDIMSYVRQ